MSHKDSVLVFHIQGMKFEGEDVTVRSIKCKYKDNDMSKSTYPPYYFFKTIDATIKKGDTVVVPWQRSDDQYKGRYTAVIVVETDAYFDFENPPNNVDWIVGKVDTTTHEALKSLEERIIMRVKQARFKAAQKKMMEDLSLDLSDINLIEDSSSNS